MLVFAQTVTIENSWMVTSRRRSLSESSLCDVSFLSHDNSRPLSYSRLAQRCMIPVTGAAEKELTATTLVKYQKLLQKEF